LQGSGRASRAVSGALAGNLPPGTIPSGEAPNGAREGACAPQQIIVHRFFNLPHCGAPMTGQTIEGTELSQRAELFFGKRHAPLEIIQRMKLSTLALPNEFFRMFLP
jgi:hypothetical protein